VAQAKPDAVFVAAGKVGGIGANSAFPADFLADNLAIACKSSSRRLAVIISQRSRSSRRTMAAPTMPACPVT
jgi:hypothetical protein